VTDRGLEQRYRRLLAAYPREFRRQHGEEILSVLMACAREGQRRPGFAASADLIRSGLWLRLRPNPPRSAGTVRAAVWLMYTGALVTIVSLVGAAVSLAFTGRTGTALRVAGRTQPFWVAITVGIVIALAMTALWLWMARTNSEGKNWARVLSTVLVGLDTLHLFGNSLVVEAFAVLTWLIGLAAVWLLWRPASTAFFKHRDLTPGGHDSA
jgi:hypothetical protein